MESGSQSNNKHTLLYIFGAILLIGLIIFLLFRNNPNQHQPQPNASISGEVDINGIKPRPEDASKGNIQIKVKGPDDAEFKVVQTIPLEDKASWTWSGAESGVNYQVKATGYYLDTEIKDSNMAQVTAPATNVPLQFNVSVDDLPDFIIDQETSPISGTLEIHGYTTSATRVYIELRNTKEPDNWFTAVEDLPAKSSTVWSYDLARTGEEYDIRGRILSSDGTTILGTSNVHTVVAPAADEVIKITSDATPPQPTKTTISGKLQINGPIAPNSTVLILQRLHGTGDYTEITRVPAVNGTTWSWREATQGTSYDIKAAYQVNGNNKSTSNTVTSTAPSSSINLTINTGIDLPKAPAPEWEACGNLNNSTYNTKLKMRGDQRATKYWVQVGTQPNGNDVFNNKFSYQGEDWQEVNVDIPQNTRVYARYAYCLGDCDSNASYSDPSDNAQKVCPEGSGTEFTGYVCNSGSKVCEGTTDANPPYSYNNEGLKQCQLNCN